MPTEEANSEELIGRIEQRALSIRKSVVQMITAAKSGHPGGSLSAADIMATLFFGGVLNYDSKDPKWDKRDRFILSKGHAAPVLYATLAEVGYIAYDELATLRRLGSRLQGHPDSRKLPGIEVSTGSLGQGLSISAGLALGLRQDLEQMPTPRVFTLLGDGELQEGQVWEAAMFASHMRLDNLIAIVDNNGLQIDGKLEDVCDLGDIAKKFTAFGWHAIETDGHSIKGILAAFDLAMSSKDDAPCVIVAHTVKGKGVSFMENQSSWHGKAPSAEQCVQALDELDAYAISVGGSHK